VKYRIGALLLLLVLPVAAQAQVDEWSPPHKIETSTASNWFPSIAVDPWDDVHVVWSSGKGEGEASQDLLMYTRAHAGSWRPANDIVLTGVGGWAARNSMAIDHAGRLHVPSSDVFCGRH
jgi:hypothetical protein